MDKTPLLGGGKGAPISHPSSEAASHGAGSSSSATVQRTSGRSGKRHQHEHSAAADYEDQDELTSKNAAPLLGDSSRSGKTTKEQDAVNSKTPGTEGDDLSGGPAMATKKRKFFRSALFPFSLNKVPEVVVANLGGSGERTLVGDEHSAAADDEDQGAVTTNTPAKALGDSSRSGQTLKEQYEVIPKTTAAAEDDSSGSDEAPDRTDLDDPSSQSLAAMVTKRRRFFPSAMFPFTLNKTPAALAANPRGSRERSLEADCADLVGRLEQFERCCSGSSSTLAEPTIRLIAAIRSVATADRVDSKATTREVQFEVLLASAALTMVASREKIGVEIATTSKKLASEAAALIAKAGSIERLENGRSNDFLFSITISGTLALLPYNSTLVPGLLQPYVSAGFGIVLYAASAGAILSFKATQESDLKLADGLNTFSFGVFSLLVLIFVCSGLLSGNIFLIVVCALLLFALHLYTWSRP